MEKEAAVERPAILARPQELIDVGEAINKASGGSRGNVVHRKRSFGDGFEVTSSDHSPSWSWTHTRIQVSIKGPGLDVTMRAEDGRSGADDPDRRFAIHNTETREKWTGGDELREEQRPEWVQKFLEELAAAEEELVTDTSAMSSQ